MLSFSKKNKLSYAEKNIVMMNNRGGSVTDVRILFQLLLCVVEMSDSMRSKLPGVVEAAADTCSYLSLNEQTLQLALGIVRSTCKVRAENTFGIICLNNLVTLLPSRSPPITEHQ